MKTNPILEETWRIKDQLAAEAGYDVDRFFAQLRAWEAAHPASGPVVRTAEELRERARQRDTSAPALREEPPPYGQNPAGQS
jgi:hypothetical protein